MTGSTKVEFAGSIYDAKFFINQNIGKFPRTLNVWRGEEFSENGNPMIYASWHNREERTQVQQSFVALGWSVESQQEREHTK